MNLCSFFETPECVYVRVGAALFMLTYIVRYVTNLNGFWGLYEKTLSAQSMSTLEKALIEIFTSTLEATSQLPDRKDWLNSLLHVLLAL